MPIKFAVKIVRLKVYIIFSQSDDLDLHSRSQLRRKLEKYFTCVVIVIYWIAFKLDMTVDLYCMAYMLMNARVDNLDLDSNVKQSALNYLYN